MYMRTDGSCLKEDVYEDIFLRSSANLLASQSQQQSALHLEDAIIKWYKHKENIAMRTLLHRGTKGAIL